MSQALLSIENLTKSYSDKLLFQDLNFIITKGQKIALVAHNGVGKSTLLNIITGIDIPDEGTVVKKEDLKIAYLKQDRSLEYFIAYSWLTFTLVFFKRPLSSALITLFTFEAFTAT